MKQTPPPVPLVPGKAQAPERLTVFERVADYVSAAMGRPANIIVWLVVVIAWTVLFAAGLVSPAGTFLPPWFTSQGFNFPLNLVTTVAELFIGFLVAAASNRSERNLDATLAAIAAQDTAISEIENRLVAEMGDNTSLTLQVHTLTTEIHALIRAATPASSSSPAPPGPSAGGAFLPGPPRLP